MFNPGPTYQISDSPELSDDVDRYQNYGISSYPMTKDSDGKGPEAIIILVINDDAQKVVIAADDRRYRPVNMTEGDVCLHTHEDTPAAAASDATHRITVLTNDSGNQIILKVGSVSAIIIMYENGNILFDAGSTNIQMTRYR